MPALTVAQLAELCRGEVEGNGDLVIEGANSLESATAVELSFVANVKAVAVAVSSHAGCLLVDSAFNATGEWSLIRVKHPREAFARALTVLYPATQKARGIHPTAIVAESAQIGADCSIGAYATIGKNTQIGSGCFIGNGCSIGENVTIGNDTTLHPNVTVYERVRIGARVILHAGCVLGSDGFGFTFAGDHYQKFPQVGAVEIGDDVEIGANCCIDRAALGVTRIGKGTKLDNLVHVAHNCDIGQHVVIAAQTGFSGSVVVGDYAVIGGQAGIGEKARIDAKSVVGGKAGILTGQRIHAGEPVWGIPARPLRQHLKGLAHVARLGELFDEFRKLKRKMTAIDEADKVDG